MMFRIAAVLALALCFFGTENRASAAADQPFTQTALHDLLNGNSIRGTWGKKATPYTQHFADGGRTMYREDGSRVTYGTWRINSSGKYCSVWPPSPTEVCYLVLQGNNSDEIVWQTSTGERYPATVSQGDAFSN